MSSRYEIIANTDALSWLQSLPDASADLILTDPPYESLEKYRAVGTTTRLKHSKSSSNDWFGVIPNSSFPELFTQFYRVLRKHRHLYLFCDDSTSDVARAVLTEVGFHVWKRLVWDKKRKGMGYHYRGRYEFILFAEKGKRKLNDLSVDDLLEYRSLRGKQYYPTQKPVPLLAQLINQSTQPGELVIDPFAGSGSTGVAALQNHRRFLGCDVSPQACARARAAVAEWKRAT